MAETNVATPEVSGEAFPPATPAIADKASKFKIGNTSTHAEVVKDIPVDPPPPAETAPTEKVEMVPEQTEDKPAPGQAATAEPAPASSPKIGSSKKTPNTPAATETPATTTAPKLADTLKAAGYDDAFIQFAEAYKAGDTSRFAQAMATDYSKMPDLQVLQESLRRANPDATPEEMEVLMDSEINDKYKLNSEVYDPEGKDVKAAKTKMAIDARRARTALTLENEKLKLPTQNANGAAQAARASQEQALQKAQTELLDHPYTKSMLSGKKVSFGGLSITGQDGKVTNIPDFSVEVEDPTEIQRIMTDPAVYQSYITDEHGKIDGEALSQISAFTMNRKALVQAMINYGKMLGKEELIEEKSNPPGSTSSRRNPGTDQPKNLKEAFAKGKHGVAGG